MHCGVKGVNLTEIFAFIFIFDVYKAFDGTCMSNM